ncbi:MAG: FecR domain-containing protein [Myxococcales bacterium]
MPAVFLLGLCLGWLTWWTRQSPELPALSFRVGGEQVQESGRRLVAPADRPLTLDFSDGSRVELGARSELRVIQLDKRGARLQLAHGSVRFAVVHRHDTFWILESGPFTTHVVGTTFEVNWKPVAGNFELTMFDGAVELTGPVIGKQTVSRSERVKVSVNEGRAQLEASHSMVPTVTPLSVPDGQPDVGTVATSIEEEASRLPSRRRAAKVATGVGSIPSERWREALDESLARLSREGRYAEVVATAVSANWEQTLSAASPDVLVLLGDAARLSGDAERARDAYERVRTRFPGSDDAAKAAFALGRLEHDRHAQPAQAARWFSLYLKEARHGPMAREAMGRLMEAQLQSGAHAVARETAKEYLEVYADGPHARLAHRLLEER